MAERTSLTLYRNSDVKVTYSLPDGYNLDGFAPSFFFRESEGGSPVLTVTSTPTGNGSSAVVVGDSVVLIIKAADASLFPSQDIFNGVYDSTLTQNGFVNRFVGGPMTVYVDGSYGEGVFSDAIFITLSGLDVPVVLEGGNLGAAASLDLQEINAAVVSAEQSAQDAEAAAVTAVAATANKANLDGGNVFSAGEAANFRANIGAFPINANAVSNLPAGLGPKIVLNASSTGFEQDALQINGTASGAASESYLAHFILSAPDVNTFRGGALGVAVDGPGGVPSIVANKRGAGDGPAIIATKIGSGAGPSILANFAGTGSGSGLLALKQNDDGSPTGNTGTGSALLVSNTSSLGFGIDAFTTLNNVEPISYKLRRGNYTGGVNLDVQMLDGGVRTSAYINFRSLVQPSASYSGASGVVAISGEIKANVTGANEATAGSFSNDSLGNVTGYGVQGAATGANSVNYGGYFSASGAIGANIALRANGDSWIIGGNLFIDTIKVVGVQGAAVADAVPAAGVPTQAEFNALVTQFNLLLARVRASTGHGLIAG